MTSYSSDWVVCGACGHGREYNLLVGVRIEGEPDLDLRPEKMNLVPLDSWIQRCPHCKYCAQDISKFDEGLRAVMKSTAYQRILADSRLPRLAQTFVCAGMIAEASSQPGEAGWSYLHAAWVLDDQKNEELARHWRGWAADVFLSLLAKGETFAEDGASELVAADCLRRAGRGAEALPLIDGALARGGDDKVRQALAFERKLIALGDLSQHGFWDARKAAERLEGGCSCGAVRYRVNARPDTALSCHCKACQRRSGTCFASFAYFLEADVEVLQGEMTEYEQRSDESGRWLRMQFCPRCGTTVTRREEARPGMLAITIGTLDAPDEMRITHHIWLDSRWRMQLLPWGVEHYPTGSPGTLKGS
jgi:hypothetical protein